MSWIERTYPDVVRDVLTNLTQGVSREIHLVSYVHQGEPATVSDIVLLRRPVRRVSLVEGVIEPSPGAEPVPYTFGLNDYELVANQDPTDLSILRFLPFGKKPADGTTLRVNYYPRSTDPARLTDVRVGSVVRTLLEAVSRELALLYQQLNLAYDSAFVDTATGASLERVVALVGRQRFRAGRPAGAVVFKRRPGVSGDVTIPVGTPVTDTSDKIRYETSESHVLLAGEATAEVRVRGATDATPVVEEGVLTVLQRAIAGLDSVTNERPTTTAGGDETDEELRVRAREALSAVDKGTVSALRHGLLLLPEVRDVQIVERPNGVPGEIQITVGLADGSSAGALPPKVLQRIEDLRPAGVRVVSSSAETVQITARVRLTLTGDRMAPAEVAQVRQAALQALVAEVAKKGVGEKVRNRPISAAILRDGRIVDADVYLGDDSGMPAAPGGDFVPGPKAAAVLDPADVSFGPEVFAQPLGPEGTLSVAVEAEMSATALPGVSFDQAKAQIIARFTAYFAGVTAGAAIDVPALLGALRDDAKYGIDAAALRVRLKFADQVVRIDQGGPAYKVLPGLQFTVSSAEVSPPA